MTVVKAPTPLPAPAASPPLHSDFVLMERVRAVNADVALFLVSSLTGFGSDQPAACLIAKALPVGHEAPEVLVLRWQARCEFGKAIRLATYPVFEEVAATRLLPAEPFSFAVQVENDEPWKEVGLFGSLRSCINVLESAMAHGYAVRSCAAWAPRF